MNNNIKNSKMKVLIKSILVIFIYIMWPTISEYIYKLFFINTSLFFEKLFNIFTYLSLLICFVYIYKKTIIEDLKDIKKNFKKYFILVLKNLLLIIILVFILNASRLFLFDVDITSENDKGLYNLFRETPILVLFLTILYYPIIEGFVFRKAIKDIIDKKYVFILVSALLYWFFNVAYTNISIINIINSLYYFVIMLILSRIYYKTNNLILSTIILILYNIFVGIISGLSWL